MLLNMCLLDIIYNSFSLIAWLISSNNSLLSQALCMIYNFAPIISTVGLHGQSLFSVWGLISPTGKTFISPYKYIGIHLVHYSCSNTKNTTLQPINNGMSIVLAKRNFIRFHFFSLLKPIFNTCIVPGTSNF